MTIVNRARLRNVLVQGGIARESAAVEAVDAFVEEFESTRGDLVTRADLDHAIHGAVAEIKQYVAETAVRIIGVTLGGTAIATAILGIIIAVT